MLEETINTINTVVDGMDPTVKNVIIAGAVVVAAGLAYKGYKSTLGRKTKGTPVPVVAPVVPATEPATPVADATITPVVTPVEVVVPATVVATSVAPVATPVVVVTPTVVEVPVVETTTVSNDSVSVTTLENVSDNLRKLIMEAKASTSVVEVEEVHVNLDRVLDDIKFVVQERRSENLPAEMVQALNSMIENAVLQMKLYIASGTGTISSIRAIAKKMSIVNTHTWRSIETELSLA